MSKTYEMTMNGVPVIPLEIDDDEPSIEVRPINDTFYKVTIPWDNGSKDYIVLKSEWHAC